MLGAQVLKMSRRSETAIGRSSRTFGMVSSDILAASTGIQISAFLASGDASVVLRLQAVRAAVAASADGAWSFGDPVVLLQLGS